MALCQHTFFFFFAILLKFRSRIRRFWCKTAIQLMLTRSLCRRLCKIRRQLIFLLLPTATFVLCAFFIPFSSRHTFLARCRSSLYVSHARLPNVFSLPVLSFTRWHCFLSLRRLQLCISSSSFLPPSLPLVLALPHRSLSFSLPRCPLSPPPLRLPLHRRCCSLCSPEKIDWLI